VQVDAKTVERWIVAARVPYRKHRNGGAAFFSVDESYIWPDALDHDQVVSASESKIITVYPYRRAVPRDAWGHLFGQAERESGILAYSCYFLAGDAGLRAIARQKSRVRYPCAHLARRSGKPRLCSNADSQKA
jgi:hypothetical protein